MSAINRASVQVPIFIFVVGTVVLVNWMMVPKATPKVNPKKLPAKVILEHAQEEMGRIRSELESIKMEADYVTELDPAPPAPAPKEKPAEETPK